MDVAARARELVRGVVEAEGYELLHVEYQPAGASSMLRIYIDKPGGVNLSDCQRVSRHVGVLLDVEDFIPHQYTLEVSSPGIERPLFHEGDYLRFQGSEIRLTTTEKIDGRRNFIGVLTGFSAGAAEVDCEGRTYKIPLEKIKKANLVYRFD
jgi:ribosome maturation factor RimP